MLNLIHSRMHRPESGWDPIPLGYAASYAAHARGAAGPEWLRRIETRTGPISGKRVLDLGGGPGEHSLLMALAGATVTWFDISRHYRELAAARFESAGVRVEQAPLGYLDDAERILQRQFELVVNNVCWYYGISDRTLARCISRLVAPGGRAMILTDTSAGRRATGSDPLHRISRVLYDGLGYKIGHPVPAPGLVGRRMRCLRGGTVEHESSAEGLDCVWWRRFPA